MATVSTLEPLDAAPRPTRQPWGAALANRRFRSLLLVLAGVPIGLAYAWYGVLLPLVTTQLGDFRLVYLEGGRVIAAGGDPYQCTAAACVGQSQGSWLGTEGAVYPPFALWIMQPLTHLDPGLANGLALVAANICVGLFILICIRGLAVRDWQERALITLLCLSFAPTLTEVQNRNLQVVVLLISALFLLGWQRGDRWWSGVALGIGLAIKLFEAPLLLLGAWGRRWWTTASAVVAWAVLWLVAVPNLLPEYVFGVLPTLGRGSGGEMNVAPLAAFARALHPESLYLQGRGVDGPVLGLTACFGLAVLLITARTLGRPRFDTDGRSRELAAAMAATPLLLTLAWAGQLVVLLLPMAILLHIGLRSGSPRLVGAVAASWLLIGPAYLAFTNAFAAGWGTPLIFELWSNCALVGTIVLWLATLSALRGHEAASQSAC
jgi:hypothetical protein